MIMITSFGIPVGNHNLYAKIVLSPCDGQKPYKTGKYVCKVHIHLHESQPGIDQYAILSGC